MLVKGATEELYHMYHISKHHISPSHYSTHTHTHIHTHSRTHRNHFRDYLFSVAFGKSFIRLSTTFHPNTSYTRKRDQVSTLGLSAYGKLTLYWSQGNVAKDLKERVQEPLLLTWMNNHIHYKMWDGVIYPFQNFNGWTAEVSEWVCNFIPYFTWHVIIYPRWK